MPRIKDLPAADPGHAKHREPVWSREHLSIWFEVSPSTLRNDWERAGVLPEPARVVVQPSGQRRRLWRPCDIVAATEIVLVRRPRVAARAAS